MTEPVATQPQAEQRTSGKAIASLVVGIVGLFIFGLILGIVAIVLGVQARKEIDADSTVGGRTLATAGIVVGAISIVLWAVVLLLWL